jgi:myo-inositol-1(or 4)-monophosphatase
MAPENGLIHKFAAFAGTLVDASGSVILPFFRSHLAVDSKAAAGLFDPVTEADRGAEKVIRALIRQHYPGHGIIGEEFGSESVDAEYVWVIDPIDGTKAFISGMLTWGTLVGLLHHGQPVLGVLDQPYLRERFIGNGKQAVCFGRYGESVLTARRHTELADAVVWVSSTVVTMPDLFKRVQKLGERVKLLRYGSDCLSMAMLAEGHIDIVIEAGLEIYDIAAQVPIVRGAGGIMTSLDGGPVLQSSCVIAASHQKLYSEVIDILGGQQSIESSGMSLSQASSL